MLTKQHLKLVVTEKLLVLTEKYSYSQKNTRTHGQAIVPSRSSTHGKVRITISTHRELRGIHGKLLEKL